MKHIENLLVPPVVVLFVMSLFIGESVLDIHASDTYFVLSGLHIAKWLAYWLIAMFVLYKLIRRKHQQVNQKWAIPHISLSIVLIGVMWLPAIWESRPMPRRYLDYENDALQELMLYNSIATIAGLLWGLVQVIFLVYFTVVIVRPPRAA